MRLENVICAVKHRSVIMNMSHSKRGGIVGFAGAIKFTYEKFRVLGISICLMIFLDKIFCMIQNLRKILHIVSYYELNKNNL